MIDGGIYYLLTVKEYDFIADTKNQQFQRIKKTQNSLHLFLTKSSLLELPPIEATHFINTALSFFV